MVAATARQGVATMGRGESVVERRCDTAQRVLEVCGSSAARCFRACVHMQIARSLAARLAALHSFSSLPLRSPSIHVVITLSVPLTPCAACYCCLRVAFASIRRSPLRQSCPVVGARGILAHYTLPPVGSCAAATRPSCSRSLVSLCLIQRQRSTRNCRDRTRRPFLHRVSSLLVACFLSVLTSHELGAIHPALYVPSVFNWLLGASTSRDYVATHKSHAYERCWQPVCRHRSTRRRRRIGE